MIPRVDRDRLAVTVTEAARLLSVSVWSVREWIHQGDITPITLPSTKGSAPVCRRVLIATSELQRFIGGRS